MLTEPVVTQYRADGTDAVLAEMEKIRAAQLKAGEAVNDVSKRLIDQSKSLEKSIAFWGKVNFAVSAIPGIINKVSETFDEMAGVLQLRSAAAGVSIDQMNAALHGQVRETDLLSLAAKANHGALKLTQTQMNQVAGAIRKLALDGHDASEVTKAFGEALTQNETGPLKKFGLGLKDVDGKSKSLADVLATDVVEASNAAANAAETGSERMRAAANTIGNAFDDAKLKIAEFSVGAVKALGDAGRAIGAAAANHGDGFSMLMSFAGVKVDVGAMRAATIAAQEEAQAQALFAATKRGGGAGKSGLELSLGDITATPLNGKGGGGGGGKSKGFDLAAYMRLLDAARDKAAAVEAEAARLMPRGFDGVAANDLGGFDAANTTSRERDRNTELIAQAKELAAIEQASRQSALDMAAANEHSRLEAIFGPLEEFNAYATAWDALGAGVREAYEAIVTGSGNAGEAFKKGASATLLAKGTEYSVLALGELGWGFADAARGLPTAAAHFLSAAKFGAGAVAAGAGVRLLGGGASNSNTASPSAQPVGGTPALGSGGGGEHTIIVVGDAFANDTPRSRQRTASNLFQQARRETRIAAGFR